MFISKDRRHKAEINKPGNVYNLIVTSILTGEIVRHYKCSIFNKTNVREIKRLVKKDFKIKIDF